SQKLQPTVQRQHTYFRDSFVLKRNLKDIAVPPNESLFTYDAVSMYTNVDTDDCLERLSTYLRLDSSKQEYSHLRVEALIEVLALVMRNNRMRFGDLIVLQLLGIAMRMTPAPTIANLFVALHEMKEV
ncbi:hypothetical protein ACHAWF_000911, partial [Thalassiosira exigua]